MPDVLHALCCVSVCVILAVHAQPPSCGVLLLPSPNHSSNSENGKRYVRGMHVCMDMDMDMDMDVDVDVNGHEHEHEAAAYVCHRMYITHACNSWSYHIL